MCMYSLVQTLRQLSIVIVVAIFLILFLPGLSPHVSFQAYRVTPAVKLEGNLKPQNILDKAVPLVNGEFIGSESIATKDDVIYTGDLHGNVMKVEQTKEGASKIEIIAKVGKACDDSKDVHCSAVPGYPLGIRVSPDGNLVLVDANNGIANINLATGKVQYLFTTDEKLKDGSSTTFPNDLDIGKDGTIFWSQSTQNYGVHEIALHHTGDNTGRLLKFDPKTRAQTVLLEGLFGANGVQLSPAEDFVLVAEAFRSKVSRFYLKGPKAGSSDVFVDGLPGLVDNIRPNGRGGYFVTLMIPRVALIDKLSEFPVLRKFVFRLQWLSLLPFKLLSVMGIDSSYLTSLQQFVSNLGPWGMKLNAHPTVIELDQDGNILRVLATTKDEMRFGTQLILGKDYAYLGGFTEFIWKIAVKDLNHGMETLKEG